MRYITINITLYNSCVMRKENGMGEENLNCQIRRSDMVDKFFQKQIDSLKEENEYLYNENKELKEFLLKIKNEIQERLKDES